MDLLKLILQSGPLAKGVLLVLVFFSIFSWAITFKKYFYLKKLRADSEAFPAHLSKERALFGNQLGLRNPEADSPGRGLSGRLRGTGSPVDEPTLR